MTEAQTGQMAQPPRAYWLKPFIMAVVGLYLLHAAMFLVLMLMVNGNFWFLRTEIYEKHRLVYDGIDPDILLAILVGMGPIGLLLIAWALIKTMYPAARSSDIRKSSKAVGMLCMLFSLACLSPIWMLFAKEYGWEILPAYIAMSSLLGFISFICARELLLTAEGAKPFAGFGTGVWRKILQGVIYSLLFSVSILLASLLFYRILAWPMIMTMALNDGAMNLIWPRNLYIDIAATSIGILPVLSMILILSGLSISEMPFKRRGGLLLSGILVCLLFWQGFMGLNKYLDQRYDTNECDIPRAWGLVSEKTNLIGLSFGEDREGNPDIQYFFLESAPQMIIFSRGCLNYFFSPNSFWGNNKREVEYRYPVSPANIKKVEDFIRQKHGHSVLLLPAYKYLAEANYYLLQPEAAIPWVKAAAETEMIEFVFMSLKMRKLPLRDPYLSEFGEYLDEGKWRWTPRMYKRKIDALLHWGLNEEAAKLVEKGEWEGDKKPDTTRKRITDGLIYGKIKTDSDSIKIVRVGIFMKYCCHDKGKSCDVCNLDEWTTFNLSFGLVDAATPGADGTFEFRGLGEGSFLLLVLLQDDTGQLEPSRLQIEGSPKVMIIDNDHRAINAGEIVIR